jgi:hypothetical protein
MAMECPCPNPLCRHVFPAAALTGAGQLTCPACGTVLSLRADPIEAVAAPDPADDNSLVKAALPITTPWGQAQPGNVPRALLIAIPLTQPVSVEAVTSTPAVAPAATSAATVVAPATDPAEAARPYRRSRGWGKIAAFVVFVIGSIFAWLAGWHWFPSLMEEEVSGGETVVFREFHCRYVRPDQPWEVDLGPMKQSLKPVLLLAMHRSKPTAWLALLARDYKDFVPPDKEVREEVIRRLGNYFQKDNLETEQREDGQLAGLRAQRLVFRGEVDDTAMSGECYILVHKGIAYWFVTWAPAREIEEAQGEFANLRRRFALVKDRKDWTEKRPTRRFHGTKAGYTLQGVETIWEEWTPATDYDRAADLALVGKQPPEEGGDRRHPKIMATVVVLLLKRAPGDVPAAMKAARDHLEAHEQELYPETTLEPLPEKASADRVGNVPGQMLPLHVKNGEKRQRYFLLAVVPQPEQVLVLECECAWHDRETWGPKFEQLLSTFRAD